MTDYWLQSELQAGLEANLRRVQGQLDDANAGKTMGAAGNTKALEQQKVTLEGQITSCQNQRARAQVAAKQAAGIDPANFRGLADLHKLPFCSKQDFRDQYPLGMSCVPRNKLAEMHMSSGSTGTPVVMPYTLADLRQWARCMGRCYIMAGANPGDTCQMSIGQGMLLVTPLQMAVVAAALANGGKIFTPYLFAHGEGEPPPAPVKKIPYDREHIELVRDGMRDVVESGTGRRSLTRWEDAADGSLKKRRFNLNVTCAGKTGTAEIGRGSTKRKNTWIIAFAPFERPTAAIAMIVERGESGGSTVAPRVHKVLAHVFGETEISAARPRGGSLERGD